MSLVQDIQPDLIHSHHLWILTALTRRVFPQLPLVATCHGSDLRQFHFCEHLRDRVLAECRRLHRTMALSRAQKSDILRLFGVPEEMVEVVGAGYNQSLFYPEAKSSANPVEIVYVGKLSRAKGVPWLLKALGLAFCKGIVKAHRGAIWLDSIPGKGSTFTFTLPIAA